MNRRHQGSRRSRMNFVFLSALFIALFSEFLIFPPAHSQTFQKPPLLPGYYDPIFKIGSMWMTFSEHWVVNGVDNYRYTTPDNAISMAIEWIKCTRSTCQAYYDKIFQNINSKYMTMGSSFKKVGPTELSLIAIKDNRPLVVYIYKLLNSIIINSYNVDLSKVVERKLENLDFETRFEDITSFADRQRYEDARSAGNVAMGLWGQSIHRHARRLLKKGRKTKGVDVLNRLVATSPSNYEAHIDLMNNTGDPAAARRSAETVLANAEDPDLAAKAAAYLGRTRTQLDAFPFLERGETGLQVILVPLPPVDASLLPEAAAVYQRITDIPVKIRRLREAWRFGAPDRPFVIFRGRNIDFGGESKKKFVTKLKTSVKDNKFGEYLADRLIEQMNRSSGQYAADRHLLKFLNLISEYRSADIRTMYVGITAANIYSGTAKYVFNIHAGTASGSGSIFSYSMMLAKTLKARPSRRRLTERIAKELVPASLKSLRIPRSADPSDPYSYSSGVARLDEKTLTLSPPLKAALKKFR